MLGRCSHPNVANHVRTADIKSIERDIKNKILNVKNVIGGKQLRGFTGNKLGLMLENISIQRERINFYMNLSPSEKKQKSLIKLNSKLDGHDEKVRNEIRFRQRVAKSIEEGGNNFKTSEFISYGQSF